MMDHEDGNELLEKLRDIFESVLTPEASEEYPSEALETGTLVRSIRHKRLGVITDAFYGDVDKDGQKIIVYTTLLFPEGPKIGDTSLAKDEYYMVNEYEYEIIAYLMLAPVNLSKLKTLLSGEKRI